MRARPKVKIDYKIRVESEIQIESILLISVSGFLEFVNLDCINFKKVEPNMETLVKFFLMLFY